MNGNVPGREKSHRAADDRRASEAVVEAVADAEGVDPTDLRPLYGVVDPDALDALFGDRTGVRGRVEFTYHGYEVQVHDDGRLVVGSP